MPTTLTTALAGQSALEDPATGLVHLGGGRYYDPSLGRPLQPNSVGGPPTVPQALNRYAATSLGQPGVAASVINTWDPFSDPYSSNVGKTAFGTGVSELTISALSRYHRASLVRTPIYGTITRNVPANEFVEGAITKVAGVGVIARSLVGAPSGSLRARLFNAGQSLLEKVASVNSRQVTKRIVVAHYLKRTSRYGTLAGRSALWLKSPSGQLGLSFALTGGYQAWLDYGNPYLNSTQYHIRWGIAGGVGVVGTTAGLITTFYLGGATAGAFLGGPPVWIGIGVATFVGIVLDVAIVPRIYRLLGVNPQRNLAPMQE